MGCLSGLISLLFVTTMMLLTPCLGFQYYVGGKDGWVWKPAEDYSHWSHRNRFQVNDTLYFKYKEGSDSVLEVTEGDYNSCNNKSPKQAMSDGNTVVTLDRSGPYFFISGNMDRCQKGQKLFLVVMATRPSKPPIHPPAVSPVVTLTPATSPLAPTPQTLSPMPSTVIVSLSPSPGPSPTRVYAPAPVPMENTASASSGLAIAVMSLIVVGFM